MVYSIVVSSLYILFKSRVSLRTTLTQKPEQKPDDFDFFACRVDDAIVYIYIGTHYTIELARICRELCNCQLATKKKKKTFIVYETHVILLQ